MRWAGKYGLSQPTEIKPGIWDDLITEVDALGDLLQRTERLDQGDAVLPEYRTTTSISVLWGGPRIPNHGIVYVTLHGVRWAIGSSEHQPPRLVLYLGEEYRGPLPNGIAADPE